MGFSNPGKHSGSTPVTMGPGAYGMPTVKLEGVDLLAKLLKEALVFHTENQVRKALKRGAGLIVQAAQRNVPMKSGLLRNSIMILPKFRRDPMTLYVGPKLKRTSRMKGGKVVKGTKGKGRLAADQPFYAAMVEYGTASHSLAFKGKYLTGKGANHPGSKKTPYMRPAYDQVGEAALSVAMDDIWAMILRKVQHKL